MFSKILIANRGEIACRVAATAKRMGVKTVAVYSDADRYAKHVTACDEAVYLGGSAPKDSYLKGDLIIECALQTGAEAIHPGYGFLSENASFAQACVDAGLVFIGPSAEAITAMGLKSESKRLMEAAGVPLIPGYHGESQDPDLLKSEADAIDYPVLIKASAGGGGKGMRLVESSENFNDSLESCRREAMTSFGSDDVLIEKYALRPRHIEIQVFGDTHGNYVHFFERDCSVQRRHQKVLEEAPAPGVDEVMREAMGTAAMNAARAVDYVGAGTVEFIVEQREAADGSSKMSFFFMEMNTRLQVEHPVTEAITGVDLVEWQLLVASGQPLPKQQADLNIKGHAIEARICAESPDNDFLPATGTLFTYRMPKSDAFVVDNLNASSVRVDDGVREGDVISPFYDSMIAKLIVHAPTRQQALAKLDSALADTRIIGVPNNVSFLRHVVNTQSFSEPKLDTALIEREKDVLFNQSPLSLPTLMTTAIVSQLKVESTYETADSSDPFNRHNGWRAYTPYRRYFAFVYQDTPYLAVIENWQKPKDVEVNNTASQFDFTIWRNENNDKANERSTMQLASQAGDYDLSDDVIIHQGDVSYLSATGHSITNPTNDSHSHTLWLDNQRFTAQSWLEEDVLHVFTDAGSDQIKVVDIRAQDIADNQAVGSLKSPMPGQVVNFKVSVGDDVKKGDALAVIEAMKIEHTILAPTDGVVAELLFAPGDLVADGDELLRLDTFVAG